MSPLGQAGHSLALSSCSWVCGPTVRKECGGNGPSLLLKVGSSARGAWGLGVAWWPRAPESGGRCAPARKSMLAVGWDGSRAVAQSPLDRPSLWPGLPRLWGWGGLVSQTCYWGGGLRAAEVRGLEAGARHLLHPAVGAPCITGCLLVPRESERSVRTGEGARAPWRGVWSVSEQGLRWRWGEPFPRPPPCPCAAPLGHWWPLGARAPGTCVLAWTLARAA